MTTHLAEDLEEQLEIVAGRTAPYTTVPDWISLHLVLDPQAKALYNVLAAHVNVLRGDGKVWPTRLALAEMLGFSREQSVDRYIKQLLAAGAIETEEIRRSNGAKGVRYTVHQVPPKGYDGPCTLAEWYQRRREALATAEPKRKPGRPRKTTPPAPAPAPAEEAPAAPAPAAAEQTPEGAAPAKVPAQKTAAKKAPAKKTPAKKAAAKPPKEKTPEELELDQLAQTAADAWWEEAKRMVANNDMGPLLGTPKSKSGKFLNLRTRIRAAFAAGYDKREIWRALHELRQWSPPEWQFDKALQKARGVRAPRTNGPTPLFRNDQWQKDTPQTEGAQHAPAVPDVSEFGLQAL